MNQSGTDLEFIDIVARLVASVAVGIGIGLSRDIVDKPIGMRTLDLVSLGAAVVALSTVHFDVLADHLDAAGKSD